MLRIISEIIPKYYLNFLLIISLLLSFITLFLSLDLDINYKYYFFYIKINSIIKEIYCGNFTLILCLILIIYNLFYEKNNILINKNIKKYDGIAVLILIFLVCNILSSVLPKDFYNKNGMIFNIQLDINNISHYFFQTLKEELGRFFLIFSITRMRCRNTYFSIILSSFIFSLAHLMIIYDEGNHGYLLIMGLMQIFFAGISYAVVMQRYGIIISWIVHFLCDFVSINLFISWKANSILSNILLENINFIFYTMALTLLLRRMVGNDYA